MNLGSAKVIKILIMHEKTLIEFKVREDIILKDLKNQIERSENINMAFYYLFYDNLNLLENYDMNSLKKVIELSDDIEGTRNKTKIKHSSSNLESQNFLSLESNIPSAEIIMYLINREDYHELVNKMNYLRCESHPYNKAYLFCSSCERLICDKCKIFEHQTHKQIIDQALYLDAYYIKLKQVQLKFQNLFAQTKLINYQQLTKEMEIKLTDYIETEKQETIKLAEEMKNYIYKIRDLEIRRLENFALSGFKKIQNLNNEAQLVFKIYNICQDDLSSKENDLDEFSTLSIDDKIEFLKKIQKKTSELSGNSSRIEKVIEKFRNMHDHDIYKLLAANKDFSYSTHFEKLKSIFFKKIKKIESKVNAQNATILIDNMEELKFKSEKSKIYNKYINLDYGEKSISKIFQPIDTTSSINIFDIKEKRIYEKCVNFPDTLEKSEINFFPKFCRSINIQGKLYVTGGETYNKILNNLFEVDCESLEVNELSRMIGHRVSHTLVNLCNIKIIAISGAYGETSCEQYEIQTDTWTHLPSVNQDRIGAAALVYCSESIYLFFGKKYDSENSGWTYIETIEKLDLYVSYPKWYEVNLKSISLDVNRQLAFCGLIAAPNEKIYLVGGQAVVNYNIQLSEIVMELDLEKQTIGVSNSILLPKLSYFIDNNFYFYNFNAINLDNEGTGFIYSVIFKEMWQISAS
jgi:hypothetical protein